MRKIFGKTFYILIPAILAVCSFFCIPKNSIVKAENEVPDYFLSNIANCVEGEYELIQGTSKIPNNSTVLLTQNQAVLLNFDKVAIGNAINQDIIYTISYIREFFHNGKRTIA